MSRANQALLLTGGTSAFCARVMRPPLKPIQTARHGKLSIAPSTKTRTESVSHDPPSSSPILTCKRQEKEIAGSYTDISPAVVVSISARSVRPDVGLMGGPQSAKSAPELLRTLERSKALRAARYSAWLSKSLPIEKTKHRFKNPFISKP